MLVQNITELTVTEVHFRGSPNQECIGIRVNLGVDLGRFGLMLGLYTTPTTARPYFDNLFWFGDGTVQHGDSLFVYTGPGTPTSSKSPSGINNVFNLFWGKPYTLFADNSIAPILFRVDAVNVLPQFTDQAQVPQFHNQ